MKITLALLSLTIAAVPTSASAQTAQQIWDACCKTHHAKTNPNVPIAPPAVPAAAEPPEISTAIKDACVVKALSRLPAIDGMRVTNSSYKFYKTEKKTIYGNVFVSVEVRGHQAHYSWLCGVSTDDGMIVLVAL